MCNIFSAFVYVIVEENQRKEEKSIRKIYSLFKKIGYILLDFNMKNIRWILLIIFLLHY